MFQLPVSRVTGKVRTKTRPATSDVPDDTITLAMWTRKRKQIEDGFPDGFRVQSIGIESAVAISNLSGAEVARYLREHPATAAALLGESYDKRYTPSTFISENGDGSFRVGWFTRDAKYECVREFENLADAATDYLLFSLGKSRWTPAK
jgi:hypothetical protein